MRAGLEEFLYPIARLPPPLPVIVKEKTAPDKGHRPFSRVMRQFVCTLPHSLGLALVLVAGFGLWNGDAQLLIETLGYEQQAASQMLAALTDP